MPIPTPLDEQAQGRLAMAALFAALVRSLASLDANLPARATAELEQLHKTIRASLSPPLGTMEALVWAMELLKEK